MPARTGAFIGFDNFRKLMRDDPIFWASFLLTMKFVVIAVAIEFVLGFALAFLIFRFVARQRLLTTLLLIPMMLAPVAVGLIWRLLLQGDFGMVTYLHARGRPAGAERGGAFVARPGLPNHHRHRRLAVDAIRHADHAGRHDEPAALAVRGGDDGRRRTVADLSSTSCCRCCGPIIALVLLLRGIDAFKEFDKVFFMTGGGPGTV